MAAVRAKRIPIRLSRKKFRQRRIERQHRWLLFWLITGIILLCILLYPAGLFVAHYYDDLERATAPEQGTK